jgi:hypothetical protein
MDPKKPKDKPATLDELISLAELEALWHCHRTTVKRRLDAAGVRPYILNPARTGLLRYAIRDIQVFVERCRAACKSSPPLEEEIPCSGKNSSAPPPTSGKPSTI